ncbi:MAG: Rpn family recombination-promoting nuclease/putative transposase [Firmicutes bacterium]|nr:Rpn family recombination-promoting nuclease/putative transposase [Bacillota bacterium]
MNDPVLKVSKEAPLYMQATGKLPFTLTNDYLFKALMQKNKKVLKYLICSLLRIKPGKVRKVEIKNPIVLGESVNGESDSKIFVLDVNVLLDDRMLINIEMQVVNYQNWPERSLTYLCRNFDHLQSGQDYLDVKPTVHIGFLDFTLFPERPEFYAVYKMINEKNHHIFTDKFVLSVVDLKHIELATEEDRKWKTDYWASLFKAATWEELRMLAKQSAIMKEAVSTMYEITADEAIREQCKAREKQEMELSTIRREKEMVSRKLKKAARQNEILTQKVDRQARQIEQLLQEIEDLKGSAADRERPAAAAAAEKNVFAE